jgi:hypothetical protein
MQEAMPALLDALLSGPGPLGRTLLTGWFSFPDGEVTAGDVLACRRVQALLDRAGLPYDTAWSPGFAPGALSLRAADPGAYRTLVFVCGPVHGPQPARLHARFGHCRRIAVGVSVVDPEDPGAAGFHVVLARDGSGGRPLPDLAAVAPLAPDPPPVVGVVLTHGQHEYGARRRHDALSRQLTRWLAGKDCARVEADTRLATDDWRYASTPEQCMALLGAFDIVVTTRLHGLVLGLRAGRPVLAVDPVDGGAKVTAQARALRWPALLGASEVTPHHLDRWWQWCGSAEGSAAAVRRARAMERASGRPEAQGRIARAS